MTLSSDVPWWLLMETWVGENRILLLLTCVPASQPSAERAAGRDEVNNVCPCHQLGSRVHLIFGTCFNENRREV